MTLFGAFGEKLSVRSASKQRGGERERVRPELLYIRQSGDLCSIWTTNYDYIWYIYIYVTEDEHVFYRGCAALDLVHTGTSRTAVLLILREPCRDKLSMIIISIYELYSFKIRIAYYIMRTKTHQFIKTIKRNFLHRYSLIISILSE